MPDTPTSPIALEARDLLPETWDALAEAETFGTEALDRHLDRVMRRVFGSELTNEEQDALDDQLLEYAGKVYALRLIDPAIDFWSKQVLSHSAGERETKAYKDRVEDLRQLKKDWTAEVAQLFANVETILPQRRRRAKDAPRVLQAGETVPHLTPNLDDLEPLFGEPEDTTGTT